MTTPGDADRVARPVRVQLSRAKGFNLQAASIALNGLSAAKVDRSTRYGNPCTCSWPYGCSHSPEFERWAWQDDDGNVSPHRCCVDFFRYYVETGLRNEPTHSGRFEIGLEALAGYPDRKRLVAGLPLLRGKNLACWCPLERPCHADALLEIANAPICEPAP